MAGRWNQAGSRSNVGSITEFDWSCAVSAGFTGTLTCVKLLWLESASPGGRILHGSLQTSIISMVTAGHAPAI